MAAEAPDPGGLDVAPAPAGPFWPIFRYAGQTCPAAFVRSGPGSRSRAERGRAKSADRGEDGAHHRACDRNLCQLEGDGAGVADDAGSDLDQLQLQAGQRPVGHGLGQLDTSQKLI